MRNGKKKFIVCLPNVVMDGITAYANVPRMGTIMATSEAGAVSQYVHRYARGAGALIVGRLNNHGGAGAYAFGVPEILDGDSRESLTIGEQQRWQPYFVAQELAEREAEREGARVEGRHLRLADKLLVA